MAVSDVYFNVAMNLDKCDISKQTGEEIMARFSIYQLYYTSCNSEQILHQFIIQSYGYGFFRSYGQKFGPLVFYLFGPLDSVLGPSPPEKTPKPDLTQTPQKRLNFSLFKGFHLLYGVTSINPAVRLSIHSEDSLKVGLDSVVSSLCSFRFCFYNK